MSELISPRTLERLARLDVRVRRAAGGGGAGERTGGAAGIGSIFLEHRSYTPGDDLRYVDWNAYGRLRSLHVKVFELEENVEVHLVLDRTGSMGAGAGSKLETGARLAALVGAVALARGDRVRLHVVPAAAGEEGMRTFEGRASTHALLESLANVRAGVDAPLGPALRATFPRVRRRAFALLVTDFLDPGDGWKRAVDFLTFRRVDLTCLQVVDPAERAPQLDGPLRLADVETGETVDVDVDDDVLQRYRAAFDLWLRSVAAYLRSKEARHLMVDAREGDDAGLLRMLLKARVLG